MKKDINIKDLKLNKEELLEKTKGKTVPYSEFIKQSNEASFKFLMRGVLRELASNKKDFDEGKQLIIFDIKGSKEVRFGKKVEKVDEYVVDDINKIEESILDYFKEEAPLKTKDQSLKEEFLTVLKENTKDIKNKKEVSFVFKTAKIHINLKPVDQFVELSGSRGARIDLSK